MNIVWKRADSWRGERLELPCGQCVGCRLERSRQWAMRCVHEASLYEDNCFITLTYNNKNLPNGSTLVLEDFQLFMKRLRKKYPTPKPGIRFYHCGEYGEETSRPHYHALLFNFDFPDKILYKSQESQRTYTSEILDKLWKKGNCLIGSVTFESAAYCARYVLKKITNKKTRVDKTGKTWVSAADHYHGRKPEYTTMSRRPGIGKEWFDKYSAEVYPDDEIIVRGKQMRPPQFYDRILEKMSPEIHSEIKKMRTKKALRYQTDDVGLRTKEIVKIASIRSLKRNL